MRFIFYASFESSIKEKIVKILMNIKVNMFKKETHIVCKLLDTLDHRIKQRKQKFQPVMNPLIKTHQE